MATVMWWYQWRKIKGCFLKIMNAVSPNSKILLRVKMRHQKEPMTV